MSKLSHDLPKMVQTFRSCDLESQGEWVATILERFETDEEGAREFLQAIARVWGEQDYWLPDDVDRERPDPGLLKAVGYRVGWHHGRKAETRPIVINFLLSSPHLPKIKDREYMNEWGEPLSLKRYQKFGRVLRNLIEDNLRVGDPRMGRAVEEWQQDLEIASLIWEELKK